MQWSTAISNTPSNWPTCRRSTSCRTSTSKRLSGFRRVSDVQKGRQQFFAFGYGGGFGVLFCGNLWYLILYWILYLLISSIKVGISTLGFLVSYIYIIIYICTDCILNLMGQATLQEISRPWLWKMMSSHWDCDLRPCVIDHGDVTGKFPKQIPLLVDVTPGKP